MESNRITLAANVDRLHFILAVLYSKLRSVTTDRALSALAYYGCLDDEIVIYDMPDDKLIPFATFQKGTKIPIWHLFHHHHAANDVVIVFKGGPTRQRWYSGTLLSLLIDRLFYESYVKNKKDAYNKFMEFCGPS